MTGRIALTQDNCTLGLAAVPAAPSPPDPASLAGAFGDGGNAPRASTFGSGAHAAEVAARLNDNATRVDTAAEIAAGMPGVVRGLGISVVGTTATIGAGLAIYDGLIELAANTTKTIVAGTDNYLWLASGGAILATDDADIPLGGVVYLGAVLASADVDYSGRVELPGGLPVRRSSDAGVPPLATGLPAHVVISPAARWLWDGSRWSLLVDPAARTTLTGSSTLADVVSALQALKLAL